MKKFEPTYCGCYGDGAHGHQHTRDACADVLMSRIAEFRAEGLPIPDAIGAQHPDDVVMALKDDMSEDANEEFAASEWLNEHAPAEGAYWGWRDGDFGLWPEEES